MRLSNLVNIGPRLEEMLVTSGVEDVDAFKELGAAKAAYEVKKNYPDTIIRLASLEGALRGTRWHNISAIEKETLEDEFQKLCQECY